MSEPPFNIVGTSFLVLSAFASTFVLEKMLVKSMMGYGLAAIVAYAVWFLVSKWIKEDKDVNELTVKLHPVKNDIY